MKIDVHAEDYEPMADHDEEEDFEAEAAYEEEEMGGDDGPDGDEEYQETRNLAELEAADALYTN